MEGIDERSYKRSIAQESPWGKEGELEGTKKLVEAMTSTDPETQELFSFVAEKFVRDTEARGSKHVADVRELLAHQKSTLEDLRKVVDFNVEGWKLSLNAFSVIAADYHYWIPGATIVYLEREFNRPLFGRKPFIKKDGMYKPNKDYELSRSELVRLTAALDELIEKYHMTIEKIDAIAPLELSTKVENLQDGIHEEEKRSAA